MIESSLHLKPIRLAVSEPSGPAQPSRVPAVRNEAPWLRTLQEWMIRIPYEATSNEMLVGMGLGAACFQVGRVLGLRALLGAGIRGPAAVTLGRAAGLAAETTGFMAASKGTLLAMGQKVDLGWRSLAREWLSMSLFLGAMRSSQWSVRQAYGPTWAPKTRWQSFHFGLAGLGASYATLAGTAAAEWKLGWRQYQNNEDLLADSLALLGSFQMGGALAHHSLGRYLAPVERSLEAKALRLEVAHAQLAAAGAVAGGGGVRLDPMGLVYAKGEASGGQEPAGWNYESMAARTRESSHVIPVIGPGEIKRQVMKADFIKKIMDKDIFFEVSTTFDPKQFQEKLVQEIKDRTQNGKIEEGGRTIPPTRKIYICMDPKLGLPDHHDFEITFGRNGITTGPVRPPPSRQQAVAVMRAIQPSSPDTSMLDIGAAESAIPSGSYLEFSRRVRRNPKALQEDLEQHDREVKLGISMFFKMESALEVLNSLPHLEKIPDGRTVTFSFFGQESEMAVKRDGRFVDSKMTVQSGEVEPPSASDKIHVQWEGRHLPPFFKDLSQLPNLLKQIGQGDYPGSYPSLIFEGKKTISVEDLREATRGKVSGIQAGSFWEILAAKNSSKERALLGVFRDGEILWKPNEEGEKDWKRAETDAQFTDQVVSDPSEIFLQLEAMSRAEAKVASKITFKHRGMMSHGYVDRLGNFMEHILELHPVQTELILVRDQDQKDIIQLRRKGRRWKSTIVGNTVPPPP